jgi:hypothetical protein
MSDNSALSVCLSSAIFCSNLCCATVSIDAIASGTSCVLDMTIFVWSNVTECIWFKLRAFLPLRGETMAEYFSRESESQPVAASGDVGSESEFA